jgi:hypothetical protein
MQGAVERNNISFVFQGPVGHRGGNLASNIINTKNVFPDAEFILSTWQGADETVFDQFDKVILNKDPGTVFIEPVTGYPNNILRQVVSTVSGLKAASRKYAVKIRTDFSIANHRFLENWSSFSPANPEAMIFSKPVAILSLGCNDPTRRNDLFHCSDFFYFGLLEDLLLYWDVEERVKSEKNRMLSIPEKIWHPLYGILFGRLAIEQELFGFFMERKYGDRFRIKYRDQFSKDLLFLSETLLLNNFLLLDALDSGVVVPERINKISRLGHHYDPREVPAISNDYRNFLESRYVKALVARYRFMPRQIMLTVFSLVAHSLLRVSGKRSGPN